jgi:hypothetical protein
MSKLKKKTREYTQVSNDLLNDNRITMKAKLLYIFINSKPDGWDFSVERIENQMKEGEKAIRAAMKELKQFSLLSNKPAFDHKGKVSGQEYILHEYTPSKCTLQQGTLEKGTLKQGTQSNKEDRKTNIEKKKVVEVDDKISSTQQPTKFNSLSLKDHRVNEKSVQACNLLYELMPMIKGTPHAPHIVKAVLARPDEATAYIKFVYENKRKEKWLDVNGWNRYFYTDFLSQAPQVKTDISDLTQKEKEIWEKSIQGDYASYSSNDK